MNTLQILTFLRRRSRQGLVLVGLSALLMLGLLTMHTVSNPGSHGSDATQSTASAELSTHGADVTSALISSTSVADMSAVVAAVRTDVVSGLGLEPVANGGADCVSCGAEPMPNHSMMLMGCILALFAVAAVLLLPPVLRAAAIAIPRRVRVQRISGTVLARPRPPSLTALSISRT